MSYFVIADVHGCLHTLREPLTHWRPAEETLVQLGDLVDRGRYSPETVELCRELARAHPGRTVFLLGNHDWGLAEHLGPHGPYLPWLSWGGNDTLRQYEQHPTWLAPHAAWLREHPFYWETEYVLFSHAGFADVPAPLDPTSSEGVLWRRGPLRYTGHRQVVGHTPTPNGQPTYEATANVIYLDTGAVFGRCLTGLRLSETGEALEAVIVHTHPEDIYPFEPLA